MKSTVEDAIEKVMLDFKKTHTEDDSIDCIINDLINEENSDGDN